jgi:DNA polymerase sigma
MKRLEEMHMLAEALDRRKSHPSAKQRCLLNSRYPDGMEKVVCIPQARVRIVKVWDPELKLASDMNVNNTLALENTRMIKTYVQIDERVRPLAMIVKHWTKRRILNDAGKFRLPPHVWQILTCIAAFGGTISSYTWICLILNFLQTRNPPIIPSLHKLPYRKIDEKTGKPSESEFADDLDKLIGFGKENKESLGQLLFQFFRVYGYEMDYEKMVISVREGRLLTREEKTWHLAGLKKEARHRLCVEEPFNTDRNLGNSADDFAWRGIHLELRRAFDLLADHGQLDKACEQYEFPNEEKTIFKKPTPAVKTVLQIPNSRGNSRAPVRGGRNGFSQKNNYNSQRRASSGASFGSNRPPFLNNAPIQPMEYAMPPRKLNEQLHDQLYHQYISLEMQSNSLRQQLLAQQRAQQAHQAQAAQIHAQAVAHAQAQAQAQSQGHNRGQSTMNGSPQKSPYLNGPSSPQLSELGMQANPMSQHYLYPYPTFYDPAQQPVQASQDAPRTNPSSPSLNNSVLRRSAHRASNASETGSHRSQSQPARTLAQPTFIPGYAPIPQYIDPNFAGYTMAHSPQDVSPHLPASESIYAPIQVPYTEPPSSTAVSSDQNTPKEFPKEYPKEYIGYYVGEQPHPRSQLQEYTVPRIPSYNELVQRRRRVSPEVAQSLLNTAVRRASRSPSPLGSHSRSLSTSVAPTQGGAAQEKDCVEPSKPADDMGPLIVNGSIPMQARELRSRSDTTLDAFPSLEPSDMSALGIYSGPHDPQHYGLPPHDQGQQHYVHEEMQRHRVPDNITMNMLIGARSDAPPLDPNSLARVPSGGGQPRSALGENWINMDPGKSEGGNQSPGSPTHSHAPQWQPISYTNSLNRIDTKNAPRAPQQEIKSAGLPLLSPVFETRTPSPTASRQDASKTVNGVKPQPKDTQQQNRRQSHTPGPAPSAKDIAKENGRSGHQKGAQSGDKGGKSNPGSNNPSSNTWQSGKKSKRKKGGNKGGESKGTGESAPVNAADKKGG